MYLENIVEGIELEGQYSECKARLNREDNESWLKTVAGFANAYGGTFYIGVEDKTNKLIGFGRKEADSERNYFNNQVNEHLFPRPNIQFTFLKYENKDKELYIIQVEVKEADLKPVILKYKGVPSIYMRRDGFSNGASYEEIIEMSIKGQRQQYDSLYSDETYKKEYFTKLFNFYSEHNNGEALKEKALSSLGFYDNNKKLSNGALLFKDDYSGGKTRVQCSLFSGFNKGSERIVTISKFDGNLIDSISYMNEFVQQRMNHSLIKTSDSRINIDAYPSRALFEGIINAIAHRDYFLDGTQIQVDMFKDRLEISSPGSFYQGEKIQRTYDLSSIISKRRNELICGILVMCNVMEAAGTGFDKIIEDYKDADENHKPYIYTSTDQFTLVLPDLTYLNGVLKEDDAKVEFVPANKGTIHDEEVLGYCYNYARSVADIASHLGVSNSTYLRNNIIKNLVEQGYLEEIKSGKSKTYRSNRNMVRLA